MQWESDQTLQNRPYKIERVLGEGGFGITYQAKHLSLDCPVVLKTPNRRLQRDRQYPKYVERFKKEAKLLAKLSQNPHPHIVRVSDLFEEDNLPCLVMDFIPGESLYDLVARRGKLPETEAIEYIKQVGSALSVCHQAGIIHRDVSPNNIIIRSDNGKAILIDFGISGNVETNSVNKAANQAFAPWEQMIEGIKEPTIDIYTLAASLYYLVTNETPTPSLARKFTNQELTPPKQYNPSLSDRVNQAILKGLEIEPENRPQLIEEWLKLLSSSTPRPINENRESNRQFRENKQRNRPFSPQPRQQEESIKLVSSKGVDYTKLRDLLATNEWIKANLETICVIQKSAKIIFLTNPNIQKIPCEDLDIIDKLWLKYSNRRFGFSIQKQIYQELGGTKIYNGKIWKMFSKRVTWESSSLNTYVQKEPSKHFGALPLIYPDLCANHIIHIFITFTIFMSIFLVFFGFLYIITPASSDTPEWYTLFLGLAIISFVFPFSIFSIMRFNQRNRIIDLLSRVEICGLGDKNLLS